MKLFDIENPVWSTFSKIMDLIIVNFLFMLCCIPIFTIASSLTALYYTTMRILTGDITYVTKDFFKSFRQNFKQALVAEAIVFDVGVILGVLTYLSVVSNAYLGKVLFVVLDLLFAGCVSYIFAYLAKFETTISKLFYNCMLMEFIYVPFTILNIGVLYLFGFALRYVLFVKVLSVFCGFALVALLQSLWFNFIFKKFMTKDDLEKNAFFKEEKRQALKEKKDEENKVSLRK